MLLIRFVSCANRCETSTLAEITVRTLERSFLFATDILVCLVCVVEESAFLDCCLVDFRLVM